MTSASDTGLDPSELDEAAALRIVQQALRGLLRAGSAEEAVAVLLDTVDRFGGRVVPADHADDDPDVLPVDLGFGIDGPLLPAAPPASAARVCLERHLPELVEDVRAVVEQLRTEERLTRDATTDPLTGLLNRRALGRVLGRLQAGSAVAVLDLDYFKALNDEHGHAAGDEVLTAFGAFLRAQLRFGDHGARVGGEEFVVAFPGSDAAQVADVLHRLRRQWAHDRPWAVTFSAGVAELTPGERVLDLLDRADHALYDAKHLGRDRVVLAESGPGGAA